MDQSVYRAQYSGQPAASGLVQTGETQSGLQWPVSMIAASNSKPLKFLNTKDKGRAGRDHGECYNSGLMQRILLLLYY